jgi:hypothetical protein
MANPWFRLYHEFATDPKVQMLSEVLQRRYIMLLCLRCCNGDVTLQDVAVAFQLRISADEYATTKAELMGAKLIDKDNKPTAWGTRQFDSDSSTARVRACRGKMKRPVTVTETKCNGTDTDTDTDTDKKIRKAPAFQRPTLSELIDEFNCRVPDPQAQATKFLNYYESNGWKVGRNAMKSWPHAVTNWISNSQPQATPSTRRTKLIENANDQSWAEGIA